MTIPIPNTHSSQARCLLGDASVSFFRFGAANSSILQSFYIIIQATSL